MKFRQIQLILLLSLISFPMSAQQANQSSTTGADVETFTVNNLGRTASFKMIRVKAGTFQMGGKKDSYYEEYDKTIHSVTLTHDYYIGETEVTQELWEAVMGNNPSSFEGAQNPVEKVSWYDCKVFINKLRSLTNQNFRLPTEAEWEYAARGGNKSLNYTYSGSNDLKDVAWDSGNSGRKSHPVKTKAPNELGIYDMSGNVSEWCEDWYDKYYYQSSPSINPTGSAWGSCRVFRGGSWGDSWEISLDERREGCTSSDYHCRSDFRYNQKPSFSNISIGFRLVLRPSK